jgi:small subunit ribosomal protein S1
MALSATVARTTLPVPMQDHFKGEDFASLLDETLGVDTGFDGSVVTGRVLRLTDEFAIVDVGLKSGRTSRKFGPPAQAEVKPVT